MAMTYDEMMERSNKLYDKDVTLTIKEIEAMNNELVKRNPTFATKEPSEIREGDAVWESQLHRSEEHAPDMTTIQAMAIMRMGTYDFVNHTVKLGMQAGQKLYLDYIDHLLATNNTKELKWSIRKLHEIAQLKQSQANALERSLDKIREVL